MKSQPDFSDTDCLNHYLPSAAYDSCDFFFSLQDAKILIKHKYSKGEADLRVRLLEKIHLIKTAILAQTTDASNWLCDSQPKADT